MTLKNKTKEAVSLFLPSHLTMEEPWKTYLEAIVSSCKGVIQSDKEKYLREHSNARKRHYKKEGHEVITL